MNHPPAGRSLAIRVAVVCALVASSFSRSLEAADQWAEQFKIPFSATVINVLDGQLTPPPAAGGAALSTVAGLNVGDPIVIDASDGNSYPANVVSIDPPSHSLNW